MKSYWNRFKSFTIHDWISNGFMFVALVIGLYFSISFSVKRGSGFTLFGDANRQDNVREVKGPTTSDLLVLSIFWIFTALLFFLFVYTFFFKKQENLHLNEKDVVDGKTVGNRAARAVDIKIDILIGVLTLEVKKLRNNNACRCGVYLVVKHYNSVVKQAGVNVIGTLSVTALLYYIWYQCHNSSFLRQSGFVEKSRILF